MTTAKPNKQNAPAAPQLGADPSPAPDVLADGDEWVGCVATGDYVGQRAEDVEWSDVIARGGRWSGVTLERWRATDVVFEDCDLSGFVVLDASSLRRVGFVRCRMDGAVLAGVRLHDVRFDGCAMADANLRMLEGERVDFADCVLTGADFYNARLSSVRLHGADLRGADFTKATMSDVDLRTSRLDDIVGADALRGATIDTGQAVGLALNFAQTLGVRVIDDD